MKEEEKSEKQNSRVEDFEEYLERYCTKHRITPEVAKQHKLVQEVKKYYEEAGVKIP